MVLAGEQEGEAMGVPPSCYLVRLSMMVTIRRMAVFLLNLKMRRVLASFLGLFRRQ
jgi:hypothetical protein